MARAVAGGAGPAAEVLAADTLVGERVVDAGGAHLGAVEDLVIDVERGVVAYAVMSCGALPGARDRLLAIPWSALTFDPARGCLVLDAGGERLAGAPDFDRDDWPSMADPAWAARVHDHFSARPYWASDVGDLRAGGRSGRRGRADAV